MKSGLQNLVSCLTIMWKKYSCMIFEDYLELPLSVIEISSSVLFPLVDFPDLFTNLKHHLNCIILRFYTIYLELINYYSIVVQVFSRVHLFFLKCLAPVLWYESAYVCAISCLYFLSPIKLCFFVFYCAHLCISGFLNFGDFPKEKNVFPI